MINIVNTIARFFNGVVKRIHFENGFSNVTKEETGERLDTWIHKLMITVNSVVNALSGWSVVTDIDTIRIDLETCTVKQLALAMPEHSLLVVKNQMAGTNPNFPVSAGMLIGFKNKYAGDTTPFFIIHTRGFYWTIWHPTDPNTGVWRGLQYENPTGVTYPNALNTAIEVGKQGKIVTFNGTIQTTAVIAYSTTTTVMTLPVALRPSKKINTFGYIHINNSATNALANLIIETNGNVTLYVRKPTGEGVPANVDAGSTMGIGMCWTGTVF